MALNKLKFNSINVTPAANQALKFNSSADGFETGSAGGAMIFIKKLTASSSSTLSFVDGSSDVVLDNTYKEYVFHFNNIHPQTDDATLQFNLSSDTGSNYNVTKQTIVFGASHGENGSSGNLSYDTGLDLVQSTNFQGLNLGSHDNDHAISGTLNLFNPSSTTFAKQFMAVSSTTNYDNLNLVKYVAGYGNTTSAIDAIQFKMSSGNIDAGTITLYGIN